MLFKDAINKLYSNSEFDVLNLLNNSIHISELICNWPDVKNNEFFGMHTGGYFYNHKNRLFEIIYDLSQKKCIYQAKRENVKYPIGLLMKYDKSKKCYLHTNRWFQAYNEVTEQFIEAENSIPVIDNKIVVKIKYLDFVLDNFLIITSGVIKRIFLSPKERYRFFQSSIFKKYISVDDERVAKSVIYEWLNNWMESRKYKLENEVISYKVTDLLPLKRYLGLARKTREYLANNEVNDIVYSQVLDEYVTILNEMGIAITTQILNGFVEQCKEELPTEYKSSSLQVIHFIFMHKDGEMGDSILDLFRVVEKLEGNLLKIENVENIPYKMTGRFLRFAFYCKMFYENKV